MPSERNKDICKFYSELCVKKAKEEYVYWRINEQNQCIVSKHLFNISISLAPCHSGFQYGSVYIWPAARIWNNKLENCESGRYLRYYNLSIGPEIGHELFQEILSVTGPKCEHGNSLIESSSHTNLTNTFSDNT